MICGTCGAESRRTRTKFTDGKIVDSCASCSPEDFSDRITSPSEKKIWMGYESMPNRYRKTEDKDGPIFMATDELRQDTEDAICAKPKEELQAGAAAIEYKRRNRRTEPMTRAEFQHALNIGEKIVQGIKQTHQQIEKDRQQAELDQWVTRATQGVR